MGRNQRYYDRVCLKMALLDPPVMAVPIGKMMNDFSLEISCNQHFLSIFPTSSQHFLRFFRDFLGIFRVLIGWGAGQSHRGCDFEGLGIEQRQGGVGSSGAAVNDQLWYQVYTFHILNLTIW